jgi:hypothetical protein
MVTIICFLVATVAASLPSLVDAAELSYSLQSPLVGGNNGSLYQIESASVGLKKQNEAKKISDALAADNAAQQLINNSPAVRFASALQSQLYNGMAMQLSEKILGTAGVGASKEAPLRYGDMLIYSSKEGNTVTYHITTPTGVLDIAM